MKKKLLAVMFGAVLVLGACGGDKADNTNGGSTAADPEALFQKSCAMCHGGNLEGKSGPELATIGASLSEDEIESVIINGKGAMSPGILKGADAEAVAKWLSEKK